MKVALIVNPRAGRQRGAHTSDPRVTMLTGQHVTIRTDQPSPALVDGDVRTQTPLEIEVAPGAALLWMYSERMALRPRGVEPVPELPTAGLYPKEAQRDAADGA